MEEEKEGMVPEIPEEGAAFQADPDHDPSRTADEGEAPYPPSYTEKSQEELEREIREATQVTNSSMFSFS